MTVRRACDRTRREGGMRARRVRVVPLENLALARWQAGHRGAHTRAKVLRLVALREFVLLRPPVVPALDELIERYGPAIGARLPLRRGFALAPTVRPSKLVHAANLVQDRPADPQACIALKGNAPLRLETVHGVDQPDQSGGLEVVRAGDRADRNVHATCDTGSQRREALDERTSRCGVALPTPCPQQGRVRQGPPPPRRTPTK